MTSQFRRILGRGDVPAFRRWAQFALLAAMPWVSAGAQEFPDNQGLDRSQRVRPSATAAKIGSAVKWSADWDTARRLSQQSGKPIFWYVPSVPQTFMDRKVEIDRYMMAGPFSWPAIIEMLNEKFIPYRAAPTGDQVEQFRLRPYEFVEPGFLVLAADDKVALRVDRLTTLHPEWLRRLIGSAVGGVPDMPADAARAESEIAWTAFRQGKNEPAWDDIASADPQATEKLLLLGMQAFRRGDQALAKTLFQRAAEAQPDHPLAWKAAAEAEGFGPFVRGMEVHAELPEGAYGAGVNSLGSAAPAGVYNEPELWRRSVEFLLGMQREDGGFLDSDYDFGGFDSLPNVHAAVTSLAGMALLAARSRVEEDWLPRVDQAIERAADYVIDPQHHNPRDRDEILWSYAYRVQFLSRLLSEDFGERSRWEPALAKGVEALESLQLKSGRWFHEYTNPFVTATALNALERAKAAGAQVDEARVSQGLNALAADREANGSFPYYSSEGRAGRRGRGTPTEASAGRLPICALALWSWKKLDDDELSAAAEIALEHHELLERAYKYDNHTSTHAYGGFFIWYDMQARAELIARVPDAALRQRLARAHREIILRWPEVDGCFVDSHELGRSYGTAMALLSLDHVGHALADQQ